MVVVEGVDEGAHGLVGGCSNDGCEKSILCFVFLHKLMMHDAGFSLCFRRESLQEPGWGVSQQLNNPQCMLLVYLLIALVRISVAVLSIRIPVESFKLK